MSATTTPAITSESHRIVRERRFSVSDGDDSVLAALSHLRREGVTGPLTIHLACGGISAISFHEEQKVTFDEK